MTDVCVFTIVSKNYISYARVLMHSFMKYSPDVKSFVLLADKIDGYFDPKNELFETIEADILGIKDFDSLAFKYNILEFNTALKPYFFDYLFSCRGFKKVIYFDPDIFVFRDLAEMINLLDSYSIILTPHLTSPLPDDSLMPSDHEILKRGCFNLGFMALSDGESTKKLLSWWKERLHDMCLQSTVLGYFVDQIWINYVPCFFDDYFVLREPGYNVAYWNLHERAVRTASDGIVINGKPLFFYHFSGFQVDSFEGISKFQNRYTLSDFSILRNIFEMYKGAIIKNGYYESSKWPYYYGFFKSGVRVPDLARSVYWGLGISADEFGNPFHLFCHRLFKVRHLKRLFSFRFFRIMLDKFLFLGWKLLYRCRGRQRCI